MKKSKLRIGVILDSIERLDISDDTSLFIFTELMKRGHEVFYIKPCDIYSQKGELMVKLHYAEYDDKYEIKSSMVVNERADSLDSILVRLEPPYDINYIFLNQLLELVRDNVFIFNDPKGLRDFSEKLFILHFSKYIPETLVSRDVMRLKNFVHSNEKTIIKQLDLYANKNLIVVSPKTKELHLHIEKATENGTKFVMAQKFIPAVYDEGDKRIVFLNGKIIGYYSRVPEEGNFRSDTDFGGKNKTAKLSDGERKICLYIAQESLAKGIYFGGIDMIGGYLTEINITCPAGIITLNELYKLNLQEEIASFIEEKSRKL